MYLSLHSPGYAQALHIPALPSMAATLQAYPVAGSALCKPCPKPSGAHSAPYFLLHPRTGLSQGPLLRSIPVAPLLLGIHTVRDSPCREGFAISCPCIPFPENGSSLNSCESSAGILLPPCALGQPFLEHSAKPAAGFPSQERPCALPIMGSWLSI